jgi:hypothetical protein
LRIVIILNNENLRTIVISTITQNNKIMVIITVSKIEFTSIASHILKIVLFCIRYASKHTCHGHYSLVFAFINLFATCRKVLFACLTSVNCLIISWVSLPCQRGVDFCRTDTYLTLLQHRSLSLLCFIFPIFFSK